MLKAKVCIITGAGRGIGKVIAERYAEEGAIVYANARMPGAIDVWAEEISAKYKTEVIPLYFDVTDTPAVREAFLRIRKERQRLDVVVNNAAIISNELLGMIARKDLELMFTVNVYAVIEIVQLAARIMSRQNSGSIINISSIVGVEGSKGQVAYSASKGAVIALTKSAAKELAPKNIRVNCVAPGMTDTGRIQVTAKEQYKEIIPEIGMGRLAAPLDIANACVFLGSNMSSYITGQTLVVEGGNSTLTRHFYNIKFE